MKAQENDYIILWWRKEGKYLLKLDTLSIPTLQQDFMMEYCSCDYSSKINAYDSELENCFRLLNYLFGSGNFLRNGMLMIDGARKLKSSKGECYGLVHRIRSM